MIILEKNNWVYEIEVSFLDCFEVEAEFEFKV